MNKYDVIVIGGGIAGLTVCRNLSNDKKKVLLLETDEVLGGEVRFYEKVAYNNDYVSSIDLINDLKDSINYEYCDVHLNSCVVKVNKNKEVSYFSTNGYITVSGDNVIFATGAIERTATNIKLTGKRLKGIFTVGNAIRFLKNNNLLVGQDVLLYGLENNGIELVEDMKSKRANVVGILSDQKVNDDLLNKLETALYKGYTIKDLNGLNKLEYIILEKDNEEKKVNIDTFIINQGSQSNTSFFRELDLHINNDGTSVDVNFNFETKLNNFYVVGNCLKVYDDIDSLNADLNNFKLS